MIVKTLIKSWGALVLAGVFSLGAIAKDLSKKQKEELFEKGTITVYSDCGAKKGHFEVNIVPGSKNISQDAKEQWKEAGDLMADFVDKEEFWKETFVGSFHDGLTYMKEQTMDKGLGSMADDFDKLKQENQQADDSFHEGREKTKNVLRLLGRLVKRTGHTAVGLTLGPLYSVLAPVGHVVYRPIAAGTKSLIAGALWPVVMYTWNGAAWVAVQSKDEPKPGDMTVTYVPEELKSNHKKHK